MQFKNLYKRTIYLAYYIRQMNWRKFNKFSSYAQQKVKTNKLSLWIDGIISVYKYNIGLIDYFYFRFFEKNPSERKKWVGTGYKYEYDLIMNPTSKRHILQNKLHFFDAYDPFIKHCMCRLEDIKQYNKKARKVLENPSGKIAIKDALGQCGWNVEIIKTTEMGKEELILYMQKKGFNMAEEFIVQHKELNRLSPAGLNTVRIITQINKQDGVDFIGPTLRITINSAVDNMAMGNIAAPIDLSTGIIVGHGVYQDITKTPEKHHPVTNLKLIGFQVPYWSEVLDLCKKAALYNMSNKSIGWDVAITDKGPSLLEGNHNWCKLLWQIPIGEGLKKDLENYRKVYSKSIS
jgi:hypothetical protein